MICIREDEKKPRVWTSTERYTIEKALEILNPSNRQYIAAEKRQAFNIISKFIEEVRKNEKH